MFAGNRRDNAGKDKNYSFIFRNWEIRSQVFSRRYYIAWDNFSRVSPLNMVNVLVEISRMDDFNNLVDAFHTFWGVLGHKSVRDFSQIHANHVHFYVIGHPVYSTLILTDDLKLGTNTKIFSQGILV